MDFQQFLEHMITDGVLEKITDSGLSLLLNIYQSNDQQPPADVLASAVARGLIPQG